MNTGSLKVYVKDGCHLCENLLLELEPWRIKLGLAVEVIDIEGDSQLMNLYKSKIPVLMYGEQEVCHYFFDAESLLVIHGDNNKN